MVHRDLTAHSSDHLTPKGSSQCDGLHAKGLNVQQILHSKDAFLTATSSLPIPDSHRHFLDIIYDAISIQSAAMKAVAAELVVILSSRPTVEETQAAINANPKKSIPSMSEQTYEMMKLWPPEVVLTPTSPSSSRHSIPPD